MPKFVFQTFSKQKIFQFSWHGDSDPHQGAGGALPWSSNTHRVPRDWGGDHHPDQHPRQHCDHHPHSHLDLPDPDPDTSDSPCSSDHSCRHHLSSDHWSSTAGSDGENQTTAESQSSHQCWGGGDTPGSQQCPGAAAVRVWDEEAEAGVQHQSWATGGHQLRSQHHSLHCLHVRIPAWTILHIPGHSHSQQQIQETSHPGANTFTHCGDVVFKLSTLQQQHWARELAVVKYLLKFTQIFHFLNQVLLFIFVVQCKTDVINETIKSNDKEDQKYLKWWNYDSAGWENH